jgi:opacity protein-like surface antigen
MKKLTFSLLACLSLAGPCFAGQRTVSSGKDYSKTPQAPIESCFKEQELQLDVFGAFADGNRPHAGPFQEHGWGGGIGLNYFFSRTMGLGVDATWLAAHDNTGGDARRNNDRDDGRDDRVFEKLGIDSDLTTIHNFSGSFIFRFPLDGACLAPYLFVGGGFHVDGEQWASAHGGAGVEYRVVPQKIGIFTDARFTYFGDRFGNGAQNNVMARAGVRFVF